MLKLFRRAIRPVVIAVLKVMPSPHGCGCARRKAEMIALIESI